MENIKIIYGIWNNLYKKLKIIILGKIYQLEKKKLSAEDKKFVTFLCTQLERDWRAPIIQALDDLLSKYK